MSALEVGDHVIVTDDVFKYLDGQEAVVTRVLGGDVYFITFVERDDGEWWYHRSDLRKFNARVNELLDRLALELVNPRTDYSDDPVWQAGFRAGVASEQDTTNAESFEAGRDEGYDEGRDEGYSEGKEDGYDNGYNEGYDAGYADRSVEADTGEEG